MPVGIIDNLFILFLCVLHFLAVSPMYNYEKALDFFSETKQKKSCLLLAIKKLNLPAPQAYLFELHIYNNEAVDQ